METSVSNPAAAFLKNVFRLFLIDLEALPGESYDQSFGPKARTVADIVHEVNVVNDEIAKVIRGEYDGPMPNDGWIKAPEGQRKKEAVVAAFRRSSKAALATVERFSPEEMEATVKNQEGEATRMQEARFMGIHTWYHLGQLNFVQTLLVDDAWHWAA